MATNYKGVEYPSVTQILGQLNKPALIPWASRCAVDFIRENLDKLEALMVDADAHAVEDLLDEAQKAHTQKKDDAADSGKLAHKAIEAHIAGAEPFVVLSDNDEAHRAYTAFLKWLDDNTVEFLESEVLVCSTLYGYAGRFDLIAMVNGKRVLIDFKTSTGIYPEMMIQLCAYRQAYNEMLHEGQETIENMALLHLDKITGEYTYKQVTDEVDRKTEQFNTLVKHYYLEKPRRLKNNPMVIKKGMYGEVPEGDTF